MAPTWRRVAFVSFLYLISASPSLTDEPACQIKCAKAGHCCQGSGSSCQKPSCAMGCLAAQQLASEKACNATCTAAAKDSQRWLRRSRPRFIHDLSSNGNYNTIWRLAPGLELNASQCEYTVPHTNLTFEMCGVCRAEPAPAWWPAAAKPPDGQSPGYWPPGYSLPACNSCETIADDPAGECKLGCMFTFRPGLKPNPPPQPTPPEPQDPPACGVFPSNPPGFSSCTAGKDLNFSTVFSSYAVLQRAPARAAVYGTLGTNADGSGDIQVKVTVSDGSGKVQYSVDAKVDASKGTWKAFLRPTLAGGSYTVTAACGSGCTGEKSLTNVTFGEVWYCAGQSNMALALRFTYARNQTIAAIKKSGIGSTSMASAIRVTGLLGNMNADQPWVTLGTAVGGVNNGTMPSYGEIPLDQFSSTCAYFGIELFSALNTAAAAPAHSGKDGVIPVGLVHTAWGGSMIEEWLTDEAIATCNGVAIGDNNENLFDTNVKPYLGMTLAGWVWYQGENNCGGLHGNVGTESQPPSGYACMMAALVGLWRKAWSVEANTTDPQAPFGVVSLSSHDSEGAPDMASFRWAQQGSYGALPNQAMPRTFMAHAFDLQDPWNGNTGSCAERPTPSPAAQMFDCTTPWYMGPGIHPRLKSPVGQRLALGAMKAAYGQGDGVSGGTIKGCDFSQRGADSASTLTLRFSMPGGRKLTVRDYNQSSPVYSATSVLVNNTNSSAGALGPLWLPTHIKLDKSDSNAVTVDLAQAAGAIGLPEITPLAVRYAWGGTDPSAGSDTPNGDDVSCCEGDGKDQPCLPAQCPLLADEPRAPFGKLPVDPFIAQITSDGKCLCPEPQVCGN